MGIVELRLPMVSIPGRTRQCILASFPVTMGPICREGYKLVLTHGAKSVEVVAFRTNLMFLHESGRPGTDFTTTSRVGYLPGVIVPAGEKVTLELENTTDEAVQVEGKIVGLAIEESSSAVEATGSLDVSLVYQHPGGGAIWVGAMPPEGPLVGTFATHLVLCARDNQHPASSFPGATVLHCVLDDFSSTPLSDEQVALAFMTARAVSEIVQRPRTLVLVTCVQGQNRSALVAALAMRMLHLKDLTYDPVDLIRAARSPVCLSNTGFRMLIDGRDERARYHLVQDGPSSAFGEIES